MLKGRIVLFWLFLQKQDRANRECVCFPVMLQPGHHRNDHGAALGVFEQVAADSGLDRAAELTVIPAALAAAGDAVSGVHGNVLQLLHQIAGFLHINESTGDDLRRGQQRAVLRADDRRPQVLADEATDQLGVVAEMARVVPHARAAFLAIASM